MCVHATHHVGEPAGMRTAPLQDMKRSTVSSEPGTMEIAPDGWIPFLAEFTRENRGAHARLEVIGCGDEPLYQVETENRPLEGVSSDVKNHDRTVWISFSSRMGAHLTH